MIDHFGRTKELNSILKFPIITTRDGVFLQQYDTWNCGVAVIAYVLEFYIHQFNSPYILDDKHYSLKNEGIH